MNKKLGIIAGILASSIFGGTEVLSKIVFDMGMDSMLLIVLRNLMAIPVVYLMLRAFHVSAKLSRQELIALLLVVLLGFSPACIFLFLAYDYIPVGHVILIHYLYPAIVVLLQTFLFKQKCSKIKWLAVALCTLGVFLVTPMEAASQNPTAIIGVLMAVASAIFFGAYLLGVEHTCVSELHPLKLSFWLCVLSTLQPLVYVFAKGTFSLSFPAKAWWLLFIIMMLYSVIGFACLQISLKHTGAVVTGIVATLEPITALVMGILVLHEPFTAMTIVGCLLIVSAVSLIAIADK